MTNCYWEYDNRSRSRRRMSSQAAARDSPTTATSTWSPKDELTDGTRTMRFIATNIEYSPAAKNRMIVGTYDMSGGTYRDCIVVVPPDPNSWCEKNWIPIISAAYSQEHTCTDGEVYTTETESYEREEELFIYKWSPMEIGKINKTTNQLQIVLRHPVNSWIFSRLRGSTTFMDCPLRVLPEECRVRGGEYVIGLTHFSEEHSPRHYYHLLVLLEKNTLKPMRHSKVFYFEKPSIEFCIGMVIREDVFGFWVSRFDRDPIYIETGVGELPLEYSVT